MLDGLKRFFNREPAGMAQVRRAWGAVSILRTLTTTAFVPALDTSALPDSVSPKAWDVVATIAGVYAMCSYLKGNNPKEYRAHGAAVVATASEVDPKGDWLLKDCIAFIASTLEKGGFTDEQALGMWMLWNLLGRTPSYDEARRAGILGGIAYHCAIDAWNTS